jgi:hypothetical protein
MKEPTPGARALTPPAVRHATRFALLSGMLGCGMLLAVVGSVTVLREGTCSI